MIKVLTSVEFGCYAAGDVESRSRQGAVAGREAPAASGTAAAVQRRPLKDYKIEGDLQKELDRAAAGDASAAGGAKPKLHLVVLGHVDAGGFRLLVNFPPSRRCHVGSDLGIALLCRSRTYSHVPIPIVTGYG